MISNFLLIAYLWADDVVIESAGRATFGAVRIAFAGGAVVEGRTTTASLTAISAPDDIGALVCLEEGIAVANPVVCPEGTLCAEEQKPRNEDHEEGESDDDIEGIRTLAGA